MNSLKSLSAPSFLLNLWMVLFFTLAAATSCSKKTTNSGGNAPPVVLPQIPPVEVTGKFEVKDSKIFDKDGNEFVAKGVNVNGPLWPWTQETLPDVSLIADIWKFNIVRINCWPQNTPFNHNSNSNLDGIIKAFTDKKVVVMIEDHSFTGSYPNIAQLNVASSWWTAFATKYKGNGYVWFNLMNEPGNNGPAPTAWLDVHETLIKAIRSAGADNMIVCDEHQYGQANGYDKATSSAALTYGEGLAGKYKNLVFSLHLYDRWIYGKDRLEAYTTAVQAKKLALIIGEYGVGNTYSMEVASSVFKVCIPKKIGRIGWHWVGQDIHKLTVSGSGGGSSITPSSGARPSNLSFCGNLLWSDAHGDLQISDPALEPPAVIIQNLNFESGSPANNSADINGWINFGTSKLDNVIGNVQEGTFSIRIDAGSTGGCGQNIYLQPGGTYQLMGWGKNSQLTNVVSNIALKYKTKIGGPEINAATLDFTDASFQEKSVTFTLPITITEMFLVIYKNDVAPAFWADDIRIVKQ